MVWACPSPQSLLITSLQSCKKEKNVVKTCRWKLDRLRAYFLCIVICISLSNSHLGINMEWLLYGLNRHKKCTYWMDSGAPVNVTDLSGIPPLSGWKKRQGILIHGLQNQRKIHLNCLHNTEKLWDKVNAHLGRFVFYIPTPAEAVISALLLFRWLWNSFKLGKKKMKQWNNNIPCCTTTTLIFYRPS